MTSPVLYYVHGSGRSGREAWRSQRSVGAVFADHSGAGTIAEKAAMVAEQAPPEPYGLVASSLGAVVAAVGLRDHGLAPRCVVLAEPALYDIARGDDAVERHVAVMTRARALADAGDLVGFWRAVKPVMFGGDALPEQWATDRPAAERFARVPLPWGHGLEAASVVAAAPTLVVTGGWNDEYEAIGRSLADHGAAAVRLPGHGHRVQDHPDFDAVVAGFVERHSR